MVSWVWFSIQVNQSIILSWCPHMAVSYVGAKEVPGAWRPLAKRRESACLVSCVLAVATP